MAVGRVSWPLARIVVRGIGYSRFRGMLANKAIVSPRGRARMKIGLQLPSRGALAEEFKILGSPPFAERGAITDEYIEVFRALWNEELPEFHGTYIQFPPLGAHPRPVQKPSIPIIVGGHTRPAIRRAARLGDG